MPPGPIVGCSVLGFPKSCHLPPFGLTADDPDGLLLVCHSFGKKWASTTSYCRKTSLRLKFEEAGVGVFGGFVTIILVIWFDNASANALKVALAICWRLIRL